MNILVTGGAGFIGSHVVDALIEKGHKVSVVDDLSSGSKDNLNPRASLYERSITDDMTDIFEKVDPQIVFHLAAQMEVSRSVREPIFDANTNILGTLNILENMKKVNSKKIIFSSTGGAIYGDGVGIPTPESAKEQPSSPYGIAKLSIEKYLYFYRRIHGIDFVSLRYSNVYGPRQNSKGEAGVVAIFIDTILNGKRPTIFGTGDQTRDYVFVKDVVTANILALEKNVEGIFNVSTGKETSVNELFKELVNTMKVRVEPIRETARPGEQMRSCLSHDKINRELEWNPEHDLKNGLKKTIEWFRNKK
jgi:UDP-glucose 4-epimerase